MTLGNKPGDVEYIRKDIYDETIETAEDHAYFAGKEKMREELPEWAKKELKNAELTDFDEFGRGEVIALRRIVNKLNSI